MLVGYVPSDGMKGVGIMGFWKDWKEGWKLALKQFNTERMINAHCKKGFHKYVQHVDSWKEEKKKVVVKWYECDICHDRLFFTPQEQAKYYQHEKRLLEHNNMFLRWAKEQLDK
jgi:hypothetical protein